MRPPTQHKGRQAAIASKTAGAASAVTLSVPRLDGGAACLLPRCFWRGWRGWRSFAPRSLTPTSLPGRPQSAWIPAAQPVLEPARTELGCVASCVARLGPTAPTVALAASQTRLPALHPPSNYPALSNTSVAIATGASASSASRSGQGTAQLPALSSSSSASVKERLDRRCSKRSFGRQTDRQTEKRTA